MVTHGNTKSEIHMAYDQNMFFQPSESDSRFFIHAFQCWNDTIYIFFCIPAPAQDFIYHYMRCIQKGACPKIRGKTVHIVILGTWALTKNHRSRIPKDLKRINMFGL